MSVPKFQTYKDLAKWLKTLSPEELNAPILATGGADDCGQTEYVFVVELVDVARENAQISGGYEGPILLVQELVGPPEVEEEQTMSEKPRKRLVSKGEYAKTQWRRLHAWYGVALSFSMALCEKQCHLRPAIVQFAPLPHNPPNRGYILPDGWS